MSILFYYSFEIALQSLLIAYLITWYLIIKLIKSMKPWPVHLLLKTCANWFLIYILLNCLVIVIDLLPLLTNCKNKWNMFDVHSPFWCLSKHMQLIWLICSLFNSSINSFTNWNMSHFVKFFSINSWLLWIIFHKIKLYFLIK